MEEFLDWKEIYLEASDPSFTNRANLGKSFDFSESISHLNNKTRIPIPVLPTLQGNYEDPMGSFTWKYFLNLKVLHKCEECEAKTPLSNQFQRHVNITLRKLSPAPETFKRHITFPLKHRFDGSVKAIRFCHFSEDTLSAYDLHMFA